MKRLIFTIALIFLTTIGFSQIEAITKDGKKVLLNASGTWKYDEEKEEVASSPQTDFDFRNSRWGMTPDEVKKTEKEKPLIDEPELLVFPDTIGEFTCNAIYSFVDGKLANGKYLFTQSHANINDFVSDYMELNKLLKEKYGKPEKEEEVWKKKYAAKNAEHWGMAISTGDGFFYTTWKLKNNKVTLMLAGDNFQIHLHMSYSNEDLAKRGIEKNREKAKDKL